ncbi:MAG TPA: NnrU family protein, partial [Candidatus Binataceae bacterium]
SLHKHSGPLLYYLRDNRAIRAVALLLMLFALIFLVGSFVNPAPSGMGGTAIDRPHRILKITRHPSFVAFTLFGFAHLLMNGWLGDLGFFGSFSALGILGGLHQDSRKVGELGARYVGLKQATSFFPGAAIISGRQEFRAGDIPWLAIGLGAALTAVIALLHPMLFGGAPLG